VSVVADLSADVEVTRAMSADEEAWTLSYDPRRIGGAFSVAECRRRLTHYRFAELAAMDAALGWIATMKAPRHKTKLAEHGYHCATHADVLGRRLPELGVHDSVDMALPPNLRVADVRLPPNDEFAFFVAALQDQDDELLRVVGLYKVLKPHVAVYYRHHALVTDPVSDAPTVRLLKAIIADEEEHIRWGDAVYEELAGSRADRRRAIEWQAYLEELLVAGGSVIGPRPVRSSHPPAGGRSVPTRRR
jgi:hypothetical protein